MRSLSENKFKIHCKNIYILLLVSPLQSSQWYHWTTHWDNKTTCINIIWNHCWRSHSCHYSGHAVPRGTLIIKHYYTNQKWDWLVVSFSNEESLSSFSWNPNKLKNPFLQQWCSAKAPSCETPWWSWKSTWHFVTSLKPITMTTYLASKCH